MVKRFLSASLILLAVLAGLLWPITAQASSLTRLVVGGTFELERDEVLNEDLTIVGGSAVLQQDSVVRGDIQILGGQLEVNGVVEGDILAAGGFLRLGETARINGDITVAGAIMDREDGAEIEGRIVTEADVPLSITRFDGAFSPLHWVFDSVWNVFYYLGVAFGLSALAVLLMMFYDRQTERTSRVLVDQAATSTGLGCLTTVVSPFALIVMILTICLMPLAFVLILIIGIAITFGWIALGLEVGKRLATQLNQDWAPPFAAGIGTFVLVIAGGFLNIIPVIGWIYTALISAAGIGAVLLTRFGTQEYSPVKTIQTLPVGESSTNQHEG